MDHYYKALDPVEQLSDSDHVCELCGNPITADAFGALAQHLFCGQQKTKVLVNNRSVDFDAAINLMDDELREHLHSTLADYDQDDPQSYQNFVNSYCAAHADKFGEDFRVD